MRTMLFLAAFGWYAQGASLSAWTQFDWNAYIQDPLSGMFTYSNQGASTSAGSSSAEISKEFNYTDPQGNTVGVRGYAKSTAQFGSLWVSTKGSATAPGGPDTGPPFGAASWGARATAAASDSLIVFGAGMGFLDAEFTFPVNQEPLGYGVATAEVDLGTTHYTSPAGFNYGYFRLLVPIQFGIPTSLEMGVDGDAVGNWLTPPETSESRLDLIALHISDASIVPLSTYSYTTRSGSQYNFEGGIYVAVPDHRCCCSSAGDWDYSRLRTTGAADKWANASDSIRGPDRGL
jgi:hypothetical protein